MLRHLSVENYVLIDRLEMELDPSLNIITGQTGAGKSILLGALGLLLGNKAESGTVRDESRNCVIEGVFDIERYGLQELFESNDIDYDPVVTIRRVISAGGKSRAYVNDLPVGLAVLRTIGLRLVDIHSQHGYLMLADDAFRVKVVDTMAGCGGQTLRYGELYSKMTSMRRELARLREETERSRRDREWLQFQVDELNSFGLREGEQAELEAEQSVLANSDAIGEAITVSRNNLDDDEVGILARLRETEQALSEVEENYSPAVELVSRLHSALLELKDISSELADRSERVESNPERLQQVTARLDAMYSLQQKHRVADEAELIAFRDRYAEQLRTMDDDRERLDELESALAGLEKEAWQAADGIHAARTAAIEVIEAHITPVLAELGMPNARFTVEVAALDELTSTGRDRISFLFSDNRNMPLQAVEKIASGGEISRVMLAVKAMVARSMQLPTIIFDEIDTGVSGRIADAMGRIIADLSRTMQVINITHLPQVASKGRTHFLVYKENTLLGSSTGIKRLTPQQRVEEIAKMLSGSSVSQAALEQAKILLSSERE